MRRIEENEFEEDSEKEKFYVLSMFPYPSGNLHMGHVRVYSIGDTFARYQRIKGRNVIHPMGWDAFGLPAENAAIERGLDPDAWTQKNIEHMKSLMERLNLSLDWSREFATCDSDYYKWTQYLFLKLFENDLVYRKDAFVNWDPVDGTVLADEQVNADGRSWRSGALVEKKLLTQWFVRTTRYCESLLNGLRDPVLKDWCKVAPEQEMWIGKTIGTTFDFQVVENESDLRHEFMTVWMKAPEYIHQVKFIAVAPDSVWNSGCVVSGALPYKVRNPMTGEVVPVFVTNFLQFPEGRDNCAGVPGAFASDSVYAQSVNLKYSPGDKIIATEEELDHYRREICAEARKLRVGGYMVSSRARDWLISRQRYWGTPIPIIHCDKCGPQGVPEEDLPVKLPRVGKIRKGAKALAEAEDWVKTKCPKCGGPGLRETDTMDTFVDSSWYYLRFLDPDNVSAPFSVEKAKKFMPVDLYVGGKEHAILHLYYARFMGHFLHSAGLLPHGEPFKRLLLQGIVRGQTYRLESSGGYVKRDEVEVTDSGAVHKPTGERVSVSWEKMSKSRFNGVEPEALIDQYGADVTKLVILCDIGPTGVRDWSEKTIHGVKNWLSRLWGLMTRFIQVRKGERLPPPDADTLRKIDDQFYDSRNYAVDMVGHSLEVTLNICVAIKKMQSLSNDLKGVTDEGILYSRQFERALATLVILSAPVAPSFASELWSGFVSAPNRIDESGDIRWDRPVLKQAWPEVDDGYTSKFATRTGTLKSNFERQKKLKKKLAKEEILRQAKVEG